MKSNISVANCKNKKNHKIYGFYPLDRPWLELVLILCLGLGSIFSIVNLLLSAHEAKQARELAIARLETIYKDLMKSENELKKIKIDSINDERAFYKTVNKSMNLRTELLKRIAINLGIPAYEIESILKSEPHH